MRGTSKKFIRSLSGCALRSAFGPLSDTNLYLDCPIVGMYNQGEVIPLNFIPHVLNKDGAMIPATIEEASEADILRTTAVPQWQTAWDSDYLSSEKLEKYAVRIGDELIALGAYEIQQRALIVHIVYMEAGPESNPTIAGKNRKYKGIGRVLIAFGIKLSVDHGFGGDVVLEAKTSELAAHYEKDFGAVQLPVFSSAAPRFLIADEAAKRIFFSYLE